MNNPVYYKDPSGHMPACMKEAYDKALAEGKSKAEAYKLAKQAYWEGQARARQQAEQAALAEAEMEMGENRPDMPLADIPNNRNKYPPRTELAQEECQRAVDVGNALQYYDPELISLEQGIREKLKKNKDRPLSPVTCVYVHENGDVSVGISGAAGGSEYSNSYAMKLQAALNESAGSNKYTVSSITAPELMAQMSDPVIGGNPQGVCAEPKATTAAHNNDSPIVGMDVRYFTPYNVPHGINGTNQMDQCDTCKHYEGEIMGYANANKDF